MSSDGICFAKQWTLPWLRHLDRGRCLDIACQIDGSHSLLHEADTHRQQHRPVTADPTQPEGGPAGKIPRKSTPMEG
jgi:hypothetical protein